MSKQLTIFIKNTTIQDIQDSIAHNYIWYILAPNFVVHL